MSRRVRVGDRFVEVMAFVLVAAGVALTAGDARAEGLSVTLVDPLAEGRELEIGLAQFPQKIVSVVDPTDGKRVRVFAGVPLEQVLARVARAPDADTLVVRCDDGWLSLIPLTDVSARHPLLATAIVDGSSPMPRALPPPRGPLFLVWPEGGDAGWWTFAVHSLGYARAAQLLAPLAPTAGASPSVTRGAEVFQKHCLHCHAVGGVGGLAAWDLSSPSIVRYRGKERVRAFILDAKKLVPDGHMPSFRGTIAARDVDALVSYLESR